MAQIPNNRMKIDLLDNGLHSLWRGIEAYESAKTADDIWSFKDAIMFIHHGIELLMKQILANHSEYLVFDDLSDSTVSKQKQANKQGVGVFFLPKPPKSVTYLNAIRRVEAFINPADLDDDLVSALEKLNSLRNQIEHYAVDLEKQDVTKLLGKIHEPLLNLLDSQLGGIREKQPAPVIKAWEGITSIMEIAIAAEKRVADIAARFNGQLIEGNLFAKDIPIQLPIVRQVYQGKRWKIDDHAVEVDVLAESDTGNWVVEVKASRSLQGASFLQVKYSAHSLNATPWLVFTGVATERNLQLAHELGVLLTDSPRLDSLEKLLK